MKEARFMGQMVASLSHDMANVLATIGQAGGLLEDYLNMARNESLKSLGIRPQFKYHEKFKDIIAQITAQVNRGQDMCQNLSRLAHSPDEDQGPADLGQAAFLMAFLCARLAKRQHVTLTAASPKGQFKAAPSLITVLTSLHQVVVAMLERCRDLGSVSLSPGVFTAGQVGVEVVCEGLPGEVPGLVMEELCLPLGEAARICPVPGGVRLEFPAA
jgi:hypothetical protein